MKIKFYKSLRFKTISIMLFLNILMFAGVYLMSKAIISKQFKEIEDNKIHEHISRAVDTFLFDLENINTKLVDWATWDDTYQFITDKNKAYIESNLNPVTVQNLKLNHMLFLNNNNELVYSSGEEVSDELLELVSKSNVINTHQTAENSKIGILNIKKGLLMFASRPIVNSLQDKPLKGTLIFTRYLNESKVKELSDVVHLPISIIRIDRFMSEEHISQLERLLTENKNVLYSHGDNKTKVDGLSLINDVFGKPAFILEIEYSKDISSQGEKSINYFLTAFLFSGLILLIFLIILINRLLIKRIAKLSLETIEIGNENNSLEKISTDMSQDEISSLQLDINNMIGSLKKSQLELGQKNNFIETILDNLVIGVAVNEISTGKTIYINKAFEEIYGWKKEVLTSVDSFFSHVYPDSKIREEIKNKITADMESGDFQKMKWDSIEITKENGEKRFVDARNIPLADQDLMVSTVVDITDRKKDKDQDEKHTKELQRLNDLMTGRELKMIELKKQIEELKSKGGDIK